VEIKPTVATLEERRKVIRLSKKYKLRVAIFSGPPGYSMGIETYSNGQAVGLKLPQLFGLKCLIRGVSPTHMFILLRLEQVLGKKDFVRGFEKVRDYSFEGSKL